MRSAKNIILDCRAYQARMNSALDMLAALDGARNPEASLREARIAEQEAWRIYIAVQGLTGRYAGQVVGKQRRAGKLV